MNKEAILQRITIVQIIFFLSLSLEANTAQAYVGPGAGFAFLGSALVFVITILMAIATLAFWPLQWLWRKLTNKGLSKKARVKRVIVVGLDGLDPKLARKYMEKGLLPNFSALAKEGGFSELETTIPSISPVAWSSFQTGVNPGAHNIFDFLTRDKRTYLPRLSSTDTFGAEKNLHIGNITIPLSKPRIELRRRSKPFWKILGEQGVFSNIIRVPISYPPEKFRGNILAAMCTPDLKGSQGTYSYYTTDKEKLSKQSTGGEIHALKKEGNLFKGEISGPENPFYSDSRLLKVPFTVSLDGKASVTICVGKAKETLQLEQFSSWMELTFKVGFGQKVGGICRFCLRQIEPELEIYLSPVNVSPAKPVLPIASPLYFGTYLAKKQGLYGTLGLLEDTWALNNQALNEENFINQVYLMHEEREEMFFNLLDKTREGSLVCVFDVSDRLQHMFWRHLENGNGNSKFSEVIPEMYRRMDELIGKVQKRIGPDDALIVMSDHGFTSFRREFNINAWLRKEGYLVVKEGSENDDTEYLQNVDWTKTKVFAIGLGGVYFNRCGREQQGIVDEAEALKLKAELTKKLEVLRDTKDGSRVVRKVYDTAKCYKGIYKDDAPDLILGCEPGYRIGWGAVTGQSGEDIFCDNDKAWSGDHCVDPECVPGVFFSNRAIKEQQVRMIDIAPTVLDLFAVKAPPHMEGRVVL